MDYNNIIKLHDKHEQTDKNTITENLHNFMKQHEKFHIQALTNILQANYPTVQAYFKKGNIGNKIPLIELLKVADYYNVDIEIFYK